MSCTIPYCGDCKIERDAQTEAKKTEAARRKKEKGKGRANGWGSGSDESQAEDDGWAGGLPGIIKVSRALACGGRKLLID